MIELLKNKFMVAIGIFLVAFTYFNGVLTKDAIQENEDNNIIIVMNQEG